MRYQRTKLDLVSVALALLVATAAGCGGEEPVVNGPKVLDVIDLHEQEYSLSPSVITIDRRGYYAIKAINDGTIPHALGLAGPGVIKATGEIAPGESKRFAVDFTTKGTYRLTCPLDGHAAKGMTATIHVQ